MKLALRDSACARKGVLYCFLILGCLLDGVEALRKNKRFRGIKPSPHDNTSKNCTVQLQIALSLS